MRGENCLLRGLGTCTNVFTCVDVQILINMYLYMYTYDIMICEQDTRLLSLKMCLKSSHVPLKSLSSLLEKPQKFS